MGLGGDGPGRVAWRPDDHMTASAAQAAAFYDEARRGHAVWTIRDANGIPAPINTDGVRSMPFWSMRSRADRVIHHVDAYAASEPVEVSLDEFRQRWLPGLARDGLLVGLDWAGTRATGYDLTPEGLERNLDAGPK